MSFNENTNGSVFLRVKINLKLVPVTFSSKAETPSEATPVSNVVSFTNVSHAGGVVSRQWGWEGVAGMTNGVGPPAGRCNVNYVFALKSARRLAFCLSSYEVRATFPALSFFWPTSELH
ncbi:hypothetical protein ACJJTC_014620 [Scirpophaga incertulas]